jgi:hypothetical protein
MKMMHKRLIHSGLALIAAITFALTGCDNGTAAAPVAVTGVTLDKTSVTLTVGGAETLTPAVAPANAANKAVSWSSSDTAVAAVSNGTVTAVGVGSAVITVTTQDGGKTADCAVTVNHAGTFEDPFPLSEGEWADGSIPAGDGEQWFTFAASADTHYIHFTAETLDRVYVQLYDDDGTATGDNTELYGSALYTSRTVTTGSAYYIKVTPSDSSNSGAYKIAFNTAIITPGVTITTLSEGVWADGSIPTGGKQWFTFTATSTSTHYIHFDYGTLSSIYVELYDTASVQMETGDTGNRILLYASYTSGFLPQLTNGSEYYIKVTPESNFSGDYKLAFNTSGTLGIHLPTENVTTLSENVWADGDIPTRNGEQWFTFAATADTHYIHFNRGTLTSVYVQLDTADGIRTGDRSTMSSSTISINRMVTNGSVYYIRVKPYSSSSVGAYQTAFNTSTTPPPITITLPTENITPLTEGVWANGSMLSTAGEQWFTFTATADTQYIHFAPGTMSQNYIQLYDAAGTTTGDRSTMSGSNLYRDRTVTTGSEYYIKVMANNTYGTYQIGFTASSTTLPVTIVTLPTENVTTLTEGVWEGGDIPTGNGEQWFTFTATAGTHYIHFNPVTMTCVYVQLYDTAGRTTGNRKDLYYPDSTHTSTVTSGSVYYIKVTPYNSSYSGSYQIAFNTTSTMPKITLPTENVTPLTESAWADGSIPTDGEQWFTFTASADTQYIHYYTGTGTLDTVYVQLYDTTGATIGSRTTMSSSTIYINITVTNGSVYYIRIRPYYSYNSGAYKIAFNTSTTPPTITITLPTENITPLTEGAWADGSIPRNGEQWFTFTASADTHYIHFDHWGSLKDVYVQLYDTTGTTTGYKRYMNIDNRYTNRTVTSGSVYYIQVTPYGTLSGDYKLAFNTSSTRPSE